MLVPSADVSPASPALGVARGWLVVAVFLREVW
jgi:hypothetical protein